MSLYNMLFGENAGVADIALATLGLTRDDVGRYRDCWLEDGKIVVHTRNGGGNRECWHGDSPMWGSPSCKHHVVQVGQKAQRFVPKDEWPDGKAPGNLHTSVNGVFGCYADTGEMEMADRYVCEAPDSVECGCTGCVICYRLPQHPDYLHDEDDDFDCTYADVTFRWPEKHRELLAELFAAQGQVPKASERWTALLAALASPIPEVPDA